MGQEAEAEARKAKFQGFQINMRLLGLAKPDAIVLHCLPAHYGEEIEYAAARTPNSAIFDQAENRMHAQNALMVLIAGGRAAPAAKKTVKPARAKKMAAKSTRKPATKAKRR
jgi:ornithine carbamoyltransferase